jgi:hypothetical protein
MGERNEEKAIEKQFSPNFHETFTPFDLRGIYIPNWKNYLSFLSSFIVLKLKVYFCAD